MHTIKIIFTYFLLTISLGVEAHDKKICISTNEKNIEKLFNEKYNARNRQTPAYDYHKQNDVVVILFKVESSGPCRTMKKIIEDVKPEFQNDPVSFIYIDTDSLPGVAEFYGVSSLPYIVFYRYGELKETAKIKSPKLIRQIVSELLQKSPTGPLDPVLKNYTLTRHYRYTVGSLYLETVQYLDGLGRDLFTISKGITPNKQDLVNLTEYDGLGRKFRTWLPGLLTTTRSGINMDSLKHSMIGSELHDQDANPYSEIKYEPGSSERVSKVYNPGKDWYTNDKAIVTEFCLNTTSYPCPYYYLTRSGTSYVINKTGNYPTNELYVTKIKDEDGNISFEFKDKLNQVVMTRQINGSKSYDTYYVYNDDGNLCVVLPPKAVKTFGTDGSWNETDGKIQELCYLYKYDSRNRCKAKKIPGGDWSLIIYDNMDRDVMSQDGNLREENKWFYHVYDNLDRKIRSNIVIASGNLSRDSIQSLYNIWFDDTYPLQNNAQDIDKPLQGNTFRLHSRLQEINYDDYSSLPINGELAFKPVYNIVATADNNIKGLITREKLYVLDETTNTHHVEKAFYYDDKARVVQIVTKNKYDRISRESYKYDFTGNLLARQEIHATGPGKADSILFTFEYDHASRLISSTAQLNNSLLASTQYTYDELGQLKTKKYGISSNAINEKFDYNIRGWLKTQTNDLFEIQLRYNLPLIQGTNARYGGNITEWKWHHKQKNGQDFAANTYTFTYDPLGRLNEAKQYIAGNLNNQFVEKGIQYDENGNILSLQRTANGVLADNLLYTYTGNKLTTLTENVRTNPTGDIYIPGNTAAGTYSYDKNGNMTNDSRKALNLSYNVLNLLKEIKTTMGVIKVKYSYLADGTKLEVRDNNNTNGFDYLGSLIYKKSSAGVQLESANFGSGVIRASNSTNGGFEVNYFLNDHLGSVRVIVDDNGNVKERNDYYPFGARHARADYAQQGGNRYKYNGKEEQTTGNLDYLDYGARMYDNKLGRWFTVDPMTEKYYSLSSYNYCANNPVLFVDPDGQDMDWYRDPTGEIKYDPTIHSAKDMKKKKIEGTYLGKTYTEENIYYSLFGHMMNLQNWEGRLYQKIDESLISHANYIKRMSEFDDDPDIFKMEPLERSVNFDIGIPFKRDTWGLAENNIHIFEYEGSTGYYFMNEVPNGMYGKFDRGDDKYTHTKAISNMGLKSGYNMYIRKKLDPQSSIVTFVFPTLESKNKFYKKWQEEFFYSK